MEENVLLQEHPLHDLHLRSVHDHPSQVEEYSHVNHQVQTDSSALQPLSKASKWSVSKQKI